MLNNNYEVKLSAPPVTDFLQLRQLIGWGVLTPKLAETSLQNSLFHVSIWHNDKLIGMGRVVGDGAMYFYIQDVIVAPDHQKLGLGTIIMDNIETYLTEVTQHGATVGLLAAHGKEGFYKKYGYIQRGNDTLGHGMCKFI